MIKKLTLENFLSFDRKQIIDFTGTDGKSQSTFGIIGSNSSGKSNTLKALDFIKRFIVDSFLYNPEAPINRELNKFSELKSTYCQLEFEVNNKNYTYTLDFEDIILFEELKMEGTIMFSIHNEIVENNSINDDSTKKRYEIKRKINADSTVMNKEELKEVTSLIRPNASFLSTLPQINKMHFMTINKYFKEMNIYDSTHTTIDQLFHDESFIQLITEEKYKEDILNILKIVDTDIDSIKTITKKVEGKRIQFTFNMGTKEMETNTENQNKEIEEIKFIKNSTEFSYEEQSHGVLKLLQVLHKLLPIIRNGGVLIVDEIENGLHPRIYKDILNLFNSSKKGQLIFTTHNLIFLDNLEKGQICIIEKYKNTSYVKHLKTLKPKEKTYYNFLREYMTGLYDTTFNEDIPDFSCFESN